MLKREDKRTHDMMMEVTESMESTIPRRARSARKRKASWWEDVAQVTAFLVVCMLIAAFVWRPDGEAPAGAEAQEQPTETPVNAALAPTAPPARTFAVDNVYWQEGGGLVVCWLDTEQQGPYELRATPKRSDNWRADMENGFVIRGTNMQGTQGMLPDLAPGVDYWLILTDRRGDTAGAHFVTNKLVPFDAPEGFNFRINALKMASAAAEEREVQTFSACEIAGPESQPGLSMGIYFDRTDVPLNYHMRVVMEDPRGHMRVVYNLAKQDAGYFGCHWTFFALRGYFDEMIARFGEVCAGDYTVHMFLNDSEAGRAAFRVTAEEDPIASAPAAAPEFDEFGLDLKLTLRVQAPAAQRSHETASYLGSLIMPQLEAGWSYPYTLYTDLQLYGVFAGSGEMIVTDPQGGRKTLFTTAIDYEVGPEAGDVPRYYWGDCTFDAYFRWLDSAYGEIPAGRYLISYYIDGAHADDVTFYIR